MSMNINAAWNWTCSKEMDMPHGQGHVAWVWICTIDMDMHHE